MATLSFSLAPPAILRLHDALACLTKFNESVSIEAEYDLLRLSTLNTAKTAYVSFVFDSEKFFSKYSFSLRKDANASGTSQSLHRFSCQIYLKALLSVFKGRAGESRDKDVAVERCDVELHDTPDVPECRLVIILICGQGVVKSYKLTYEPVTVQHALFDQSRVQNQWKVESKLLREIIEHFSPSAEQLDMYPEGGKAFFTSFTTKVTDGKEILKQPFHTSVTLDSKDFEEYTVKNGLHVAINVKDFKAAVIHADTVKASITARYTKPCRPLQLHYIAEGIESEFTLMTRGEVDENEDGEDAPNVSRPASQLSARPAMQPATSRTPVRKSMPAPPSIQQQQSSARPAPSRSEIMSTPASRAAFADLNDSLFVPADDDRQWDEQEFGEEEEQEDMLTWNSKIEPGAYHEGRPRPLTDSYPSFPSETGVQQKKSDDNEMAIPPTQRISQQIRNLGLFD
ncbi:putative DNA repair protein rad9 [Talaromyces proteolyticus]|uniref:DNA repair protein rad9 n=1 Tax=Talaromyces proteolyticus TaxID=1131652 RepID=A0AAD4KKE6_9EURO|nr:putative DNA repair protein rad9 [Talaromyces proteolyticus]KAH8691291.1 putative DNA repair protein rad9 [Talaromyces proteolyticus]